MKERKDALTAGPQIWLTPNSVMSWLSITNLVLLPGSHSLVNRKRINCSLNSIQSANLNNPFGQYWESLVERKMFRFSACFLCLRPVKWGHSSGLRLCYHNLGLSKWHSGKESACQSRRHKRCQPNPWVWKIPGGENGNLFEYSSLGNPTDRGACQAAVHGVAAVHGITKSQTWLSTSQS